MDERSAIEDAIFSKLVDWRKQIKRGLVNEEDHTRLAAKIQQYTAQVKA